MSVVPLPRWEVEQALPGAPPGERHARFGSFLPDVELLDAAAFGLSAAEAVLLDPQQRLILDVFQQAGLAAAGRGLYSRWVHLSMA